MYNHIHVKNILGFIDWEGIFYECSYGEHSEVAYNLAKKLLKLKREEPEDFEVQKIYYSIIRFEEGIQGICYIFLPSNLNDLQLIAIHNYYKTASNEMKLAIDKALNSWFISKDEDSECVENLNEENYELFTHSDFGVFEDSLVFDRGDD